MKFSEAGLEVSGGVLLWPDEDDGAIRFQDDDGNTGEVRRYGELEYDDWILRFYTFHARVRCFLDRYTILNQGTFITGHKLAGQPFSVQGVVQDHCSHEEMTTKFRIRLDCGSFLDVGAEEVVATFGGRPL